MTNAPNVSPPASPFENARSDRQALIDLPRMTKAIADAGMDAAVALSAANVTYTGGAFIQTPILPSAVVTRADGAQTVVVNEADAHVFHESSWISDVRPFPFEGMEESERAAVRLLSEVLSDHGLLNARIGIESGGLSWRAARELERIAPTVDWSDADAFFGQVRLIKTPGEIELLRIAAQQTDKAIGTAFAMTRPGDTERDLAARIQANLLRQDADAIFHAHVQFGVRGTVAHSLAADVACDSGDVLHVDIGGCFLGYHSDVSRNAVVAPATPRQTRIYASLSEVHRSLLDAVRPGLEVRELVLLAQAAFERHGLRHPWATFGHSVGLSLHEGLELTADTEAEIQAGMVLAIEPSHIEPDDARYDIEDIVLVTGHGAEVFSTFLETDAMFEVR